MHALFVCEEYLLPLAACLYFERPTYSVSESSRRLSATLRLDIPASYNITAKITTADMEANGEMCIVL